MASSNNDDLSLVIKLNKKIKDAEYIKEEKLLKILNTLLCVNMTLDILQKTHIGVTVNPLKKVEGKVGEKAKELVKKWKKLLPDKSKTDATQSVLHNTTTGHTRPQPPSTGPSLTVAHDSVTTRPKSSYKHELTVDHSSTHDTMSILGSGPLRGSTNKARSPKLYSHEKELDNSPNRKRKFDEDPTPSSNDSSNWAESVAASSTKRSRTQVYSGKSAGLKYVPSLFDTCMNILIDNIDAIEEVGGVPFFILEPVLSKCSPTQLMRLEEFNPHLIEDSDGLWEKHVLKEFKGVKPTRATTTWRDLYINKVEERERKMKSITSVIKARQQAREEPVRKAAILKSTPLPPSRPRRGFYSRNGPSSSTTDNHSSGTNLMKQTMKMAKNRQMMMAARSKR